MVGLLGSSKEFARRHWLASIIIVWFGGVLSGATMVTLTMDFCDGPFEDLMDEETWYTAPVHAWRRRQRALQELSGNAFVHLTDPDLAFSAQQKRFAPLVALATTVVSAVSMKTLGKSLPILNR